MTITNIPSTVNIDKLKKRLELKESNKLSAYQDSEGYWTIGIGHLIDAKKGGSISIDTSYFILNEDIEAKCRDLNNYLPWYKNLDDVRQRVMIELCFNLGIQGLLGFHRTLDCIEHGNYEEAAIHLLGSKAAKQTGNRYEELADMLMQGTDL